MLLLQVNNQYFWSQPELDVEMFDRLIGKHFENIGYS
jgi:hypothetical protein